MPPRVILIDGYNVIRTTPGLAVAERNGDLAAGRTALLRQLTSTFARCPDRIIVVFDGAGPAEACERLRGVLNGQVMFSRRGETADTLLLRLAAELGDTAITAITLITNDAEVRQAAVASGAAPLRSDALAARLNQAPKYLRQHQRAKQGLRQRWETSDEDGEPIRVSRKGNPHRAPRQRNRAPHPRW
ncbi:MAG TPA: NYN domain-containing protein [Ktedonobacterales bacterium]